VSATTYSPRELLLPYQRAYADDPARWKIGVWSRQTGKDFSSSEEAVRDCLTGEKRNWLIAAPSERQSLETLAKCREWAEAYNFAIADATQERFGGSNALLKASTIEFSNGSRIIAVPGRPDTVRGFSANVLLTEFAFFEDSDATWRAILPSVTNPLRGGKKNVRIISTPNGRSGRFFKMVDEALLNPQPGKASKWSVHKVTIHDAVRLGLPVDIEELKAAIDDPEGWAQEFECEFLDTATVLLPYDLLGACETIEATEVVEDGFWAVASSSPLVCGIDFGRQNDPTVCWTLQRLGDVWWTREVLVLRGVNTVAQAEILSHRVRRAGRVCLDYTGPGIGLGDILVENHGGQWRPESHEFGKTELCNFSAGFKREIFPKLRAAFDKRSLRIPVSVEIREDLHAMQQLVRAGAYTYAAPRTAEGHSDRCTALALALRATGSASGPATFTPLSGGDRSERMRSILNTKRRGARRLLA